MDSHASRASVHGGFVRRSTWKRSCFLREQDEFPEKSAFYLVERIARNFFAGAIESHDATIRIKHNDQRPDCVKNRRYQVAFLLERLFGSLQLRNVESDAVNKPGPAVFAANHLGIALKPNDSAVSSHDSIG